MMSSVDPVSDRWIIGITGASGTIYARRLLSALTQFAPRLQLDVIVSDSALRVMREEEDLRPAVSRVSAEDLVGQPAKNLTIHSNRNIGASIASGSCPVNGMVIVPCSMKTLAAVACGLCDNLIQRAADVTLKEGRKLILVPRETPLSAIHLENMLKLSRLGACILPAMPGFYHQPATIDDLVDMLVMRILDQLGLRIDLTERWKTSPADTHGSEVKHAK